MEVYEKEMRWLLGGCLSLGKSHQTITNYMANLALLCRQTINFSEACRPNFGIEFKMSVGNGTAL